jgi:MFS family permease
VIKSRIYSLIVPWSMESGLVMLQTAMPLLAVSLGANYMMLGALGWVAQSIRTPVCLTSGHLSERVGRSAISVPSAVICAVMMVIVSRAQSPWQIFVPYAVALAAIGAFYPPLQAMIGDVSSLGQLRKNLGMFNVGWCVGGAMAAWIAGMLIPAGMKAVKRAVEPSSGAGLSTVFYVGAVCCVISAVLILTWRAKRAAHPAAEDESGAVQDAGDDFGPLLPISRMGHFVGFFGYSVVRILFPRLAITTFGWSGPTVAKVIAVFLWGLGVGILLTNVSPWWRGRLWPQLTAQFAMLASAAGLALVCLPASTAAQTPVVVGALFFVCGMAQSISYTGALYYGLSSRKGKGTNTGIHEALVSSGCVSGCLIGGIVAEKISVVAPFVVLAGLAGAAMIATGAIWARRPASS